MRTFICFGRDGRRTHTVGELLLRGFAPHHHNALGFVWVALRALRLKLPEIAKPATGNLRGHIVGGAPAGGQRAGIRPHGVTRTGTLIGRANLGKREEKNTSSRTF